MSPQYTGYVQMWLILCVCVCVCVCVACDIHKKTRKKDTHQTTQILNVVAVTAAMVRRPSSSCKMQVITEDQIGGVYCHKGDSLQTFLKLCLTQKLTR